MTLTDPADRIPAETEVDVLIVGAGQAGLAVGHHLAAGGRSLLLVDAAPEVGHSWRTRWDSLRLFTPSEHDALPGMPFPAPAGTYPSKDDVADYLARYAETFDLPVRLRTRVERLTRLGSGFVAETTTGWIRSRQVVVATGPFQRPVIPALAAALPARITQLHSSGYRNPAQLPAGPVLVVGGGNSGLHIAAELAADHEVTVAIGSTQRYVPQTLLGRDLFWWMTRLGLMTSPASTRRGRAMKARGDLVVGTRLDDLTRRGVRLRGRAVRVVDGTVVLADGDRVDPATVVWATGYRRDYDWLDIPGVVGPNGDVRHTRGCTDVPGLSFIGLPWQHTRGSALLGFVRHDAAWLANHIDRALVSSGIEPEPASATPLSRVLR